MKKQKSTETEIVSFKVSGEFVTRQSRTFIMEDRWEDGLHLLKDCIIGCDYDIAVEVLSGEKKCLN